MISILLLLVSSLADASQVRELSLKPQDVGVINTSVKFSTVIQVNEKPLNVVIGDQNAFRVEFIGNNITVKPLRAGAKTNLFIFTENDRFNLTLQSGKAAEVNYVVRLKRVFDDPSKSEELNLVADSNHVRLTVLRSVRSSESTFFDFKIENLSKKTIDLIPEQLRFVISGSARPINDLFLEKTTIEPNQSAFGSMKVGITNPKHPFVVWLGTRQGKPVIFSFRVNEKERTVVRAAAF